MQQLSMLDLMMPPPPQVVAKPWMPPPTRAVVTRTYGVEEVMEIGMDERDPIELEVRGIPTLVRFSSCFQTYAVLPAGSEYWSETGFRSFAGLERHLDGELTPEIIAEVISANIDSKHGCNGKLTKWWPDYCRQWRQKKHFADRANRATTWDQFGAEKQAEYWAEHDVEQAVAVSRMAAEGIDPSEVWRTR